MLVNMERKYEVVYTSQQTTSYPSYQINQSDFPVLLDPNLLRAARQIYRVYYEVHPHLEERPIGIAINRNNLRGQLIFGQQPILLPSECFVPLQQLESGLS